MTTLLLGMFIGRTTRHLKGSYQISVVTEHGCDVSFFFGPVYGAEWANRFNPPGVILFPPQQRANQGLLVLRP